MEAPFQHHRRRTNAKQIMKEPIEMQPDPSLRLDSLIRKCKERPQRLSVSTENGLAAVTESHQVLTRLKEDGCDLIGSLDTSSNVRIGRQLIQREKTEAECTALTEDRLNYVEQVNVELQESWRNISVMSGPHQLTIELGQIKDMSTDVLNAQQELINRLRDEVDRAEQAIQREIERQTDDLGVMRKRMRDHLDATRSTQTWQLDNIDTALGEDYTKLLTDHSKQIDEMLNEMSTEEDQILTELNDSGQQWCQDLHETDIHYYNAAHDTRQTLTDNIHKVETELEKLKADITLNNEILDYNCRILKMREQERADFAFRQKRKIARLTERYHQLKVEYDKSHKKRLPEKTKLKNQMIRLKNECQAMEAKYFTIKNTNDRQLEDLCDMAEERLDQLLYELAKIDERIFVEILEQPWDQLVGKKVNSDSPEPEERQKNLEDVMEHLEKELKFLLIRPDGSPAVNGTKWERLMKTLDVPDQLEFETLLGKLGSIPEKEFMSQLTEFVRRHHSRKVDDTKTRHYLTDAQSIRTFFEQYRENAVPRIRLDMWKMLAKALIQYERILRDRLTLAANFIGMKR